MMPTDSSILVDLIDNEGNKTTGLIKVQMASEMWNISFYRQSGTMTRNGQEIKRYSVFSDCCIPICHCEKIIVEQLKVTVKGSRINISFLFQNNDDIVRFFDYLNVKVKFESLLYLPGTFILKNKKNYLDSVFCPLNYSFSQLPNHLAPLSLKDVQIGNFIFSSPIETTRNINYESFWEMFDEDGKVKDINEFLSNIYNAELDPSIRIEAWKMGFDHSLLSLTNAERAEKYNENLQNYKIIKNEWKQTTIRQWNCSPNTQQLINDLEQFISEQDLSRFGDSAEKVKKLMFEILLTNSVWDKDNASCEPILLKLFVPIFNECVVSENDDKITIVGLSNPMEYDEAGAIVMQIYDSFLKGIRYRDIFKIEKEPLIKTIFLNISTIIMNQFPPLLDLLNQKYVNDLQFIFQDLLELFLNAFPPENMMRIWFSIGSRNDVIEYLSSFVAVFIYSLSPAFCDQMIFQYEDFLEIYKENKSSLNPIRILNWTGKLQSLLHPPMIEPVNVQSE